MVAISIGLLSIETQTTHEQGNARGAQLLGGHKDACALEASQRSGSEKSESTYQEWHRPGKQTRCQAPALGAAAMVVM